MQYIQAAAREEGEGCFLCSYPERGDDEKALILGREGLAFVILNAYPYNPGHLLVAPFRHVGELGELTDQEVLDTTHLLQRTLRVLGEVVQPHGYNIGLNLGRVAGAGVPGHIHMHVLPRWSGDTNFMTTVAETRVLPETAELTFEKLRKAFQQK